MKKIIKATLLLSVVFLASCSQYYVYHTANGKNLQNTASEYVYDGDTVKIVYDFWANKGKMSFSIYNKLNIPIFIDWKNSAMIVNDNKHAYWQDKEVRKGRSTRYASSLGSTGTESSVAIKEERISSIPPRSKIKKIAVDKLRKKTHPKTDGLKMTFRNFIAISADEDAKFDTYVDNEFEVIKIDRLKKLPDSAKSAKDFYARY